MKNAFLALLAAVAIVALPAMAQAGGGGGTKPTSSIKITNNGAQTLVVFLDLNAADFTTAHAPAGTAITDTVQATFNTLGGVRIDPGKSATFGSLKAGNHVITSEYIGGTATAPVTGVVSDATVTLNKNQKLSLTATGTDATGVTLH